MESNEFSGSIIGAMGLDWKNGDHQICLVDQVRSLLNRGYTCYLEYEIFLQSSGKRCHKLIVDIYAKRGTKEIIIEIGTLSVRSEGKERLGFIKELMPNAKIVWIQQWKNYGITDSRIEMLTQALKAERQITWERQEKEQEAAIRFMAKQINSQGERKMLKPQREQKIKHKSKQRRKSKHALEKR